MSWRRSLECGLAGLLACACTAPLHPAVSREAPLVAPLDEEEVPSEEEDEPAADTEVQAGPEGVLQNIEEDTTHESILGSTMGRFDDWRARLKEEHRLAFGVRYQMLYQRASDVLQGDRDALGYIFRLQGAWIATPPDARNSGRLEWRLESRNGVGGFQAPTQLSDATGTVTLVAGTPYSNDFDLDLDVLSWVQTFNEGRLGLTAGRLSFAAHVDAFFLQSISAGLLNRVFFLNPTLGTTGIGALGVVGKARVGENMWAGAQIYDANAVNGEFDLDTFREDEWLTAFEWGWTPSIERSALSRIQATYWSKDELSERGVRSGNGWLFSASWDAAEGLIPFARAGFSNGGGGARAEASVSTGFEYTVARGNIWSVGAGWARPSSRTYAQDLDDEYVLETSYEVQLSRNLSLMPDVQLVIDPALDPDEESVWVLGLRMILTL